MIVGIFSSLLSLWSPAAQATDLQLTRLFCSLRDQKFLTQLEFRMEIVTNHPVLVGELSNFMVQSNGTRKYLSGILFTHIRYDNNKVIGDTGDPSDPIGRFTFTRLDSQYNGRWSYVFQRSEYEVVRGIFNCSYSQSPPRGWLTHPRARRYP